jgi:hypothetical protein
MCEHAQGAAHHALLGANPFASAVADVHEALHCALILHGDVPHLIWRVREVCLPGRPGLHSQAF